MRFFLPLVLAAAAAAATTSATRTTWDGVYTAEQAARGKRGYQAECARCHGDNLLGGEDSPALVDQPFLNNWQGKSVGTLVEYTQAEMPSDGPGNLSRQLCTDVVAYLLSVNGFPAGTTQLEPDLAALDQILFQTKKP